MDEDDEAWYFDEGKVSCLLAANGVAVLLALLAVLLGFSTGLPLWLLQGLAVVALLTHFVSYALCPLSDVRLLLRFGLVVSGVAFALLLR